MKNLFRISKKTLKTARNRFFHLVILSVVMSVFAMLVTQGMGGSQDNMVAVTLMCAVVFVAINTAIMRDNMYTLIITRRYFKANFLAYFAYVLLGVIVYFIDPSNMLYTWMFMITKFLVYSALDWPTWLSAMIFHMIMIIAIFAAPIGLYGDK